MKIYTLDEIKEIDIGNTTDDVPQVFNITWMMPHSINPTLDILGVQHTQPMADFGLPTVQLTAWVYAS